MSQAVPTQNPAVALRSHYKQLRALLVVAMIAIVGLAAAVVIVANESDDVDGTGAAQSIEPIRYGGFNPATGRPESAPLPQQEHPLQSRIGSPRYDGGPEEGTRGPLTAQASPGTRYDGGPEEGSRGSGH